MSNTKQDRIDRIAVALGSTAKTVSGLKKFAATHGFPEPVAVTPAHPHSTEYASRRIGRDDLLVSIACAVEAKITCRHSKYSEWSYHRQSADYIRYARSANCRDLHYINPCVRWQPMPGGDAVCVVYTDRGKIATALTVSWKILKTPQIDAALVPGDVCSSGSATRRTRYALDLKKMVLVKTGIAAKNADGTWEHAADMAGIAVARAEKARKIAEEKHSAKIERLALRIERLCKKIELTYEDAKKLNYCDAGIQGFLRAIGLPIDAKKVPADLIPASADHRWQPVRHIAALRIAEKIAA